MLRLNPRLTLVVVLLPVTIALGSLGASASESHAVGPNVVGVRGPVALGVGLVPSGGGSVYGVSCPAPGACTAAGQVGYAGFVDQQGYGHWSPAVDSTSGTPGAINGSDNLISCPTPENCGIAGEIGDSSGATWPFVASEVGGAWSQPILVATDSATISSISCPAPGACTAVGNSDQTSAGYLPFLVTESNGVWGNAVDVRVAGNVGGILNSIDCPTTTSCVAVGSLESTTSLYAFEITESGSVWGPPGALVPLADDPYGSNALDVTCPSAGNCVAAGWVATSQPAYNFSSTGLIAVQHGSSWSVEPPPTSPFVHPTNVSVDDVSCPAIHECTAVGEDYLSTDQYGSFEHSFVIDESATGWSGLYTLANDRLTDPYTPPNVACSAPHRCIVAGTTYLYGDNQGTYVQFGNDGVWSDALYPMPRLDGDFDSTVRSLSCTTNGFCEFGGQMQKRFGIEFAYVQQATIETVDQIAGFAENSAKLTPHMRARVAAIARGMAARHVGAAQLAGYSDNTGTTSTSLDLSLARANAVAAVLRADLRSLHVAAIRVKTTGYGSVQFVATNSTQQGRAANRRVTLAI